MFGWRFYAFQLPILQKLMPRHIAAERTATAAEFPVVTITGPRQADKKGVQAFAYVAEGIQHRRRLRWKGYNGPVPHWQGQLRRAKIDYRARPLPSPR